MKRLCICVLYDKDGLVKDYVLYYLKALQNIIDKFIVVVNEFITPEGREEIEKLGIEVITRENKGLDFGAWKDAINYLGYNKLSEFDELILTNTTCYGPIYPLSEMFNEMESRNVDFWGVTKHPEQSHFDKSGIQTVDTLEHIQSYFIVYNKNLLQSKHFKTFWENIKYFNDYDKVVKSYETNLTKYFEDNGFKSDSYIPLSFHKNLVDNPVHCSDKLLEQYRLPLLKRKSIVLKDYDYVLKQALGYQNREILNYVQNKTTYPSIYIYKDVLQSYPMSTIKHNWHLNYVLNRHTSKNKTFYNKKIATILYIYYEDLVDSCYTYLQSLPVGTDIYIVSSNKATLEACKKQSSKLSNYNIFYREKDNRGRDVSAYLITCADVFKKYDYICCVHDKKNKFVKEFYGIDFMKHCFENLLSTREYVENILDKFENSPNLGLLCPPTPHFGELYDYIFGNELAKNREHLISLYELLSLKIPFDNNPCAPFGSMFLVKSEAIKPLFRHNWEFKDFPEEPLPADGTISHAIERIYPAIAQEAGFLSGWSITEEYSELYIENLSYSLANKNIVADVQEETKTSLLEQIFSLKNTQDKRHKIITILGIKIKIRKKRIR